MMQAMLSGIKRKIDRMSMEPSSRGRNWKCYGMALIMTQNTNPIMTFFLEKRPIICSMIYLGFLCGEKVLCGDFCSQGVDESCAYECHCAESDECRSGICPSGCERGPLGYDWSGPACQIGNVGLGKVAYMSLETDIAEEYPPDRALDGIIPASGIDQHCSHPDEVNREKPAEWWADLGSIYRIFEITIYGRTDCCEERLQQFELTVHNSTGDEVLCAYQEDIIYTFKTIPCSQPVVGQYVHFRRLAGPLVHCTALCEVVIIGHKIYNCSNCPPGVACNDLTGCEYCPGSSKPECTPGGTEESRDVRFLLVKDPTTLAPPPAISHIVPNTTKQRCIMLCTEKWDCMMFAFDNSSCILTNASPGSLADMMTYSEWYVKKWNF